MLICVPIIPLSIVCVQKFAKKLLSKYWTTYTNLGDTFLENIQGLTTLKIYQYDEIKHKEMNKNAELFRKATMKVLIMQLNSISIMDIVAYGGTALGIIVSLNELYIGNINFLQCMLVVLLSAEFFIPLRQLGSFFHVAMNGVSASEKIFKILDTKDNNNGSDKIPDNYTISFSNVSFSYNNDKDVLKNISFNLDEKGLFALVGKSGCGKSTISSILTGRLRDYKGNITIGNTELKNISEKALMKIITLVNHNSYIFKGTIEDNLKTGKEDATESEMLKALEKVNLLEFVNSKKGLSTEIAEQGSNLSGGQKQRLALARAILHNSEIYIFDEATSNIDVESEENILSVIYELAKEKCVILISHRLANVVHANKIFSLKDGHISENGNHNDLMENKSHYFELYTNQKNLEKYNVRGDK